MPNRILRDGILDSERVNRLDDEEETFYRRLMSIVDDHGRWEAHRGKLRARLYPLKLDTKPDDRIGDLLLGCVRERLVYVYAAEGKVLLQLLNFRQQARSESKYPPPNAQHLKSFAAHVLSPAEMQQMLAHAQQMIAGAHLGVFVFGGVVVSEDVVVVGSRERGTGGPTGAATTTTTDPKGHRPKNLEAVIAFGASIALSEDECRKFYRFNQARKWRGGEAVADSWAGLLRVWQERAEERAASNGSRAKNDSGEPPGEFDPHRPNAHTGGLPVAAPETK